MLGLKLPPLDASKALFWAFLGLLVWAPIPLGSNRPWAWTLLEIWVYLLVAVWVVLWSLGRIEATEPARAAWPAWILLGGWLLLQTLYVVPMPTTWIAV